MRLTLVHVRLGYYGIRIYSLIAFVPQTNLFPDILNILMRLLSVTLKSQLFIAILVTKTAGSEKGRDPFSIPLRFSFRL